MIGEAPKFLESPFFRYGEDGWELLPGALKEVQDEFDEYMKELNTGMIRTDDDPESQLKNQRSKKYMEMRRRSDSRIAVYDENSPEIVCIYQRV